MPLPKYNLVGALFNFFLYNIPSRATNQIKLYKHFLKEFYVIT